MRIIRGTIFLLSALVLVALGAVGGISFIYTQHLWPLAGNINFAEHTASEQAFELVTYANAFANVKNVNYNPSKDFLAKIFGYKDGFTQTTVAYNDIHGPDEKTLFFRRKLGLERSELGPEFVENMNDEKFTLAWGGNESGCFISRIAFLNKKTDEFGPVFDTPCFIVSSPDLKTYVSSDQEGKVLSLRNLDPQHEIVQTVTLPSISDSDEGQYMESGIFSADGKKLAVILVANGDPGYASHNPILFVWDLAMNSLTSRTLDGPVSDDLARRGALIGREPGTNKIMVMSDSQWFTSGTFSW